MSEDEDDAPLEILQNKSFKELNPTAHLESSRSGIPSTIVTIRLRRQERAREKIELDSILTSIFEVENILSDRWDKLSRDQISALRLRSDVLFRKLNKILPDEKHAIDDTAEHSKLTITWDMSDGSHSVQTSPPPIDITPEPEKVECSSSTPEVREDGICDKSSAESVFD